MRLGSMRGNQAGFTYLAVIFMVAIAGILLAANGVLWSAVKAQEDREELLYIGEQIRRAIGSYYEGSPGGAKRYPKRLEDLVTDERHAIPQRHLRKLYRNPLTDGQDWKLVVAPDGGVMGVSVSIPNNVGSPEREFVYRPPIQ